MNNAQWRLTLWGVDMFIAIPKVEKKFGWFICLVAKSKGQAKRIITQRNFVPENFDIVEVKE